MKKIYDPSITLLHTLITGQKNKVGLYHNVVQKGNVGSTYIYALQHHGKDNYVFRANPGSEITYGNEIVKFTGDLAGGHTQTWEYANKSGCWFVGTKGKQGSGEYIWDTQIARVKIPGKMEYTSNTQLSRLSHLNSAGNFGLAGKDFDRSEAAVSQDYKYFLIVVIDIYGNGYFSLYNLKDINEKLDQYGTTAYNISGLSTVSNFAPFKISGITKSSVIGSLQGFDVDHINQSGGEQVNIYVSSESAPAEGGFSKERHIYKIPWGETNSSNWDDIDLTNNSAVDYGGYPTEFEGIQVTDENQLYLTVAYHGYLDNGSWGTVGNRIYKVKW